MLREGIGSGFEVAHPVEEENDHQGDEDTVKRIELG
jgi:hypothetical protein